MTSKADAQPRLSNAYELFILLMTIYSLVIMAALLLPRVSDATAQVLNVYDNAICVIFLFDFGLRWKRATSKRGYFIGGRGWLDLLGSIPSFGVFHLTALFRLARLSRLARITRLMRGQSKRELFKDVLDNRGQYAVFVTLLTAVMVLSLSSVLVLQFEGKASDANIKTGGRGAVVGGRHAHHGRLRRLLSGHPRGSHRGSVRDVRRSRDHRVPGEHPRDRVDTEA